MNPQVVEKGLTSHKCMQLCLSYGETGVKAPDTNYNIALRSICHNLNLAIYCLLMLSLLHYSIHLGDLFSLKILHAGKTQDLQLITESNRFSSN